ncbi:MAG: hypothetical protein NTX65_13665 [Ignavibacteriales bacterium]|nr:hypothetical protein [Ignavibacteriales bacterium]
MFFEKAKKLFASASLFTFLVGLSGCGMWTDFTTYFNTYYNAKTLFDQVEEEIKNQKKDLFVFREDLQAASQYGGRLTSQYGTQPTNQFGVQPTNSTEAMQTGNRQQGVQPNSTQFANQTATPQLSGTLNDNLKKVVEKCSKILQYEKNSSYFADALFITGKALYYQQEYARAQRKFTELAGVGKTKYSSENKLWLAKTDLQLHDFDEGLKLINDVKTASVNEGNDALFNDASITKISFLIFREEQSAAIDECKDYLSKSKDDEICALVSYQMGKIYLQLNDAENAFQAFTSVSKYSPTVDIDFKSRFESAKLLKSLKRLDESETAFNDLRYLGKFKNYLDQVLIEIGQIYVEKDRINPAIDIFREVDTTYRQFPTSGIAEARLGEIYRKKLGLYDSAYTYYSRAAISMAPREDKTEAGLQATNLNKYFAFKEEEKDLETKIGYKKDPTLFVRDSVDYEIAYRQYMDDVNKMSETQTTDPNAINQQKFDISFLEQQYKQQQLVLFRNPKIGLIPTPSQLIALGRYKKPENVKLSADTLGTILAKSLYGLASLFYSELDRSDSAYFYFKKILNDFPDKPVKVQTMYALGTYYETHNDSVKADSIFKYIYDNFEKDPLRNAVAQKLGLVKKEENIIVAKKEADPAEKFYDTAEQLYYSKKYVEAIDSFRTIYLKFPESSFAPKSAYYIGLIYENNLKMYDSAASSYGMIIKDFAKSPLAGTVLAKLTEYKNEKERIRKEEENKQKELEAKQKEKEAKSAELNKTVVEQQQKREIGKDDKIVNRPLLKVPAQKQDSLKSPPSDSLKTKTDTTKLKRIEK